MLIECMVQREGPSVASIMGFTYTFKEQPDGAKVCDVINGGHRERMLSMPAFYRVYQPKAVQEKEGQPLKVEETGLEIPDFSTMGKSNIIVWARKNLGIKIKAALPKDLVVKAAEDEMRRKGMIA